MRAVPIVAMQPERQLLCAALRGGIGLRIGPFAQRRLDEALRLAVGSGRVGLRAHMLEAKFAARPFEELRLVAGAVVAHDAPHGDAEAFVIGDGSREEGDRALLSLVGQDLGKGDARGIVDGHMDVLPSDAAGVGLARPVAGDAMADPRKAAELLDVDMDHVARRLVLVAADRLGRVQVLQARQAGALQDPADGGRRDTDLAGDVLAREALAPEADDPLHAGGVGGSWHPVGAG